MIDDEITLWLMPFGMENIKGDESSLSYQGVSIRKCMMVSWCALPDILYERDDNRFVGLSFLIERSNYVFVQEMVNKISNSNFRYVKHADNLDRYIGFGDNDRLELYWDRSSDNVFCELASLDTGVWIYREVNNCSGGNEIPLAFNLLSVTDIKDGYGLK